jgi:hypothetical protein
VGAAVGQPSGEDQVADRDVSQSFILAIDLFSVNAEQAIPTWYSAAMLLMAAVLLGLIAAAKRTSGDRDTRYWTGLAAIFLYLSVDEGAVIHEVLADWLQTELNLGGYLAFAWQIVAAPLVIIFVLFYLRFLFRLPPRTRNLFLVAGALYTVGALVVDAVSANQWDRDRAITFRYLAIGTLEELFEMLGVVVLIYTLLSYAVEMRYTFTFHAPPLPQTASESAQVGVTTLGGYRDTLQSLLLRRPVIGVAILMVGLNLALLYWASVQEPAPRPATSNPAVSIQTIIDQLATDDVVVTRMAGRFGVDNLISRQVAASLLTLFDDVMVVTSASTETSFALAADELPFDRDRLAEVLHANGVFQFVIFDTPAVKAIVGNVQAVRQN